MTREEKRLKFILSWVRQLLERELPDPDQLVEEAGAFLIEFSDNAFKITVEDITEPAAVTTMAQVVEKQRKRRPMPVYDAPPGYVTQNAAFLLLNQLGCKIGVTSLSYLREAGMFQTQDGVGSSGVARAAVLYLAEEIVEFARKYPGRSWKKMPGRPHRLGSPRRDAAAGVAH